MQAPQHPGWTDDNGQAIVDVEALSASSAEFGIDALNGKAGAAQDCLKYSAAIILRHLGRADSLRAGAELASRAIASGRASAHFQAG